MNNSDYIVGEVRKYRNNHARMFGYDLHRICLDLRRVEKKSANRVTKLLPARIAAKGLTGF